MVTPLTTNLYNLLYYSLSVIPISFSPWVQEDYEIRWQNMVNFR